MFKHLLRHRTWTSALSTGAIALMGLLGCAKTPSPPELPVDCHCDLVPIRFVALPLSNAANGKTIKLSYSVYNAGTEMSPDNSFQVELYIDGKLTLFDRSCSGILPESQTDYSGRTELPVGTHKYRLLVAPLKPVHELNETNNVITGEFEVN